MTATKTPFPERMHRQSVESHARRAVKALSEMIELAAVIRDKLQACDYADTEAVAALAGMVTKTGIHLSALEVLRETREWDEAERIVGTTHEGRSIDARNNIPAAKTSGEQS